MADPVPVLLTPLVVNEETSLLAEQIVTAMVQIMANGTIGAESNTSPTILGNEIDSGTASVFKADTREKQLFIRQLAVAFAQYLGGSITTITTNLTAENVGELLYSIDGASLVNKLPMVSKGQENGGWLVNNSGFLLVNG